MPADYQSTARALALPIDDEPRRDHSPLTPAWHRRSASYGQRRHANGPAGFRDRLMQQSEVLGRRTLTFWNKMPILYKILAILGSVVLMVLGILFLVYSESILKALGPAAQRWREVRGGWLILWAATFFVSFPPMIGYSTCVTLAGFVYGMYGWFIIASATIVGSTCSFLASRTVLKGYVARFAKDKRFAALALTLKHDGLKLLCMIRLCPLPYSLSNGAIATFPTVKWYNFLLATALASPKLLIHIFIGSRLAAVVEDGGEMDGKTKVLNWFSILFGVTLGITTGVVIYQKTKARAAQLEAEEADAARSGGRSADEGSGEEYADDSAGEEAVQALRRPDEISLHDQDDGDSYHDWLSEEDEDARDVDLEAARRDTKS